MLASFSAPFGLGAKRALGVDAEALVRMLHVEPGINIAIESMTHRHFPLISGVLIVALLGCINGDYRWHQKFAVVEEGVLLRGSLPTVSQLDEVRQRYGVKTIVSLVDGTEIKQPESEAERAYAEKHNIHFIHLPTGIPRPQEITRFFEIVNNRENWPVLVHCVQGTVRTGIMVAIFRIENEGWSNQQALDEMISYGFNANFPQHGDLTRFVLGYRRKGAQPQSAPAPVSTP